MAALVVAVSGLPGLAAGRLGSANPDLSPAEPTLLVAYLTAHARDLVHPPARTTRRWSFPSRRAADHRNRRRI